MFDSLYSLFVLLIGFLEAIFKNIIINRFKLQL